MFFKNIISLFIVGCFEWFFVSCASTVPLSKSPSASLESGAIKSEKTEPSEPGSGWPIERLRQELIGTFQGTLMASDGPETFSGAVVIYNIVDISLDRQRVSIIYTWMTRYGVTKKAQNVQASLFLDDNGNPVIIWSKEGLSWERKLVYEKGRLFLFSIQRGHQHKAVLERTR